MTTLAYWRPILERLVKQLVKAFDEVCPCTLCRNERMYAANRKKSGGGEK